MAKLGKLTKLRSAIKRWPSFTKITRTNSAGDHHLSLTAINKKVSTDNDNKNLRAVYVGKSRRQYLVRSETINHPLLQELVDKSSSGDMNFDDNEGIVVACEVVLFEHLLWMLETSESQLGSLDELVEFYTC